MVLNEAANLLAQSLRTSEDVLTRNMLASSASWVNCTGGTNGKMPTEISRADVDEVNRMLLSADGRTILDSIGAEDKFGTGPTRDAYICMSHTDMTADLANVNGFIQKAQYPSSLKSLSVEWGAIGNVRFMVSSKGSISENASSAQTNVYNNFITAMEAYTVVEQGDYSAAFIYRPAIYDSPLALNSTAGYTFAQAQAITNDAWIINLRATIS